jgi:hypothetical protein
MPYSVSRLVTPDFEAARTKTPNEAIFNANQHQTQPLVLFDHEIIGDCGAPAVRMPKLLMRAALAGLRKTQARQKGK